MSAVKQVFRISKNQIKAVRTLASKAFPDDETFRTALSGYGAEHTGELSYFDARDFITKLSAIVNKNPKEAEKFTKKKKYYGTGERGRQRHLTPLQAERILLLEELLGWNEVRTRGFIKKQINKDTAVQMLMNYEAVKVIVGMQRIFSGGNKDRYKEINEMTLSQLKNFLNKQQ